MQFEDLLQTALLDSLPLSLSVQFPHIGQVARNEAHCDQGQKNRHPPTAGAATIAPHEFRRGLVSAYEVTLR